MTRLYWRIFFSFWLAMIGVGLLMALALWQFQEQWVARHNLVSFARPSRFLVSSTATSLRLGGPEMIVKLAERWPAGRGQPPFVVDTGGHELLGREVAPEVMVEAKLLALEDTDDAPVQSVRTATGETFWIFYPEGLGPADHIWLRFLIDWPWLGLLTLALGSLGFSFLLAASLARPIRSLKGAFDQMAQGELDVRVEPSLGRRHDELGELGRHFDLMVERLGQMVEARRQLLHDVSHELRSPLARLTVALDLARQRPERTAEALERIESEAHRLDRLIGEVLTLARIEGAKTPPVDEYVDLVELLRSVVDDVAFEAEASGQSCRFDPGRVEEIVLRGNGELLHRAFENVLRNAIHHGSGEAGVEVRLDARPDAGEVTVRVLDRGEGVPAQELATLFEPFARGAGSKGTGLGLAITRRAVEVHGGRVRAANREGGGLEVEIVLPWAPVL
ncbi:MAG: HAMP domain-containing protein [Acidobacteria bacterium]|nr:HAMP domain-containing protein [Acidobacteriota bacterium]